MKQTIYFLDKSLTFSTECDSSEAVVLPASEENELSRAKVLKILETTNHLVQLSDDPAGAFRRFATEFTVVEAAGGVVVNRAGEWLMIYRNGRWDLPKGHVEADERYDSCAQREIAEETGVEAEVLQPLCETWHAYFFPRTERWELKRTHWYLLRTLSDATLQPQVEEGIDRVAWCDRATVDRHLAESFPTIRRVIEALRTIRRR